MRAPALLPVPLVLGLLLLSAGCGSSGGDTGGEGGNTDTSAAGAPASLIPPVTVTNPTTGPPSTDPASSARAPDASGCDPESASPEAVAADLDVRIQLGETLTTGPVRWTITVTNTGDETASLVYPTAQDGDVALRKDEREAYRWSASSAFAQVVRCQVLGPGQQYRFELTGTDLDVEPGTYQLEASLAAVPPPDPARVSVTVVAPEGN